MTVAAPTYAGAALDLTRVTRVYNRPLKPVKPVDVVSGTWWVANVAGLWAEDRLAHDLEWLGVDYYLPTRRVIGVRSGKKPQIIERPEFPKYVFAAFAGGDADQQAARFEVSQRAWETRREFGNKRSGLWWLTVKDQQTLVSQLASLQKALADGDPIVGRMEGMRSGLGVRVVAGPLLGCEGVIDRTDAQRCRLWLNLNILGASRAVEIDPAYVEVIE